MTIIHSVYIFIFQFSLSFLYFCVIFVCVKCEIDVFFLVSITNNRSDLYYCVYILYPIFISLFNIVYILKWYRALFIQCVFQSRYSQ